MKQICPSCGGSSWQTVRRTDRDGNTIEEQIPCGQCGGSGWVDK